MDIRLARREAEGFLEPHTRLVQGVEIFAGGALRARAEYRYNQPLPSGIGDREWGIGNGRNGNGPESASAEAPADKPKAGNRD